MPRYDWDQDPKDPQSAPVVINPESDPPEGHRWEDIEPSTDHDPVRFYVKYGVEGIKRRLNSGDPIGDVLANMFTGKRGSILDGRISRKDEEHFFDEFRKTMIEKLEKAMPEDQTEEKIRRAADEIEKFIRDGWEEYKRKHNIRLID